jgi:hypothetical protein
MREVEQEIETKEKIELKSQRYIKKGMTDGCVQIGQECVKVSSARSFNNLQWIVGLYLGLLWIVTVATGLSCVV